MFARELLSYREFHENRINAETRSDKQMDVVSTHSVDRISLRTANNPATKNGRLASSRYICTFSYCIPQFSEVTVQLQRMNCKAKESSIHL